MAFFAVPGGHLKAHQHLCNPKFLQLSHTREYVDSLTYKYIWEVYIEPCLEGKDDKTETVDDRIRQVQQLQINTALLSGKKLTVSDLTQIERSVRDNWGKKLTPQQAKEKLRQIRDAFTTKSTPPGHPAKPGTKKPRGRRVPGIRR